MLLLFTLGGEPPVEPPAAGGRTRSRLVFDEPPDQNGIALVLLLEDLP